VPNATERRCKATSRSGERCRAHVVNAAGYCVAHDPEKPMDMRALGRRSGEARRKPNPERVPASLRDELRNLDPKVVRAAIEQTLAGGNESARVSAVKLLADVDAFRKDESGGCPRCAKFTEAEGKAARAKVDEMIARLVERAVRDVFGTYRTEGIRAHASASDQGSNDSQVMRLVRVAVMRGLDDGGEHGFQDAVETAVGRILDAISNGLVVDNVVSADRAAEILEGLEELGLVAGRETIERRAEERAQERLAALKQEHGIPA
jgi:hypothetical protein